MITNNLVNVTIIMLCNFIFGSLVEFKAKWLDFLVITVFLTFLLLLFGEIMPKVYSRSAPLKFCRKAVGGILLLRKLFWPLETVLIKSGVIAEKAVPKEKRQLSVDDLEQALELTDKDDIQDEQSMLKGIIRFGVTRSGGQVTVSIWNTGPGIAPEALPFVFDRFFKEDRSRGLNTRGSGLGLHICKVLVNLSGGKIWVESQEGEWCRFSFTLPAESAKKGRK